MTLKEAIQKAKKLSLQYSNCRFLVKIQRFDVRKNVRLPVSFIVTGECTGYDNKEYATIHVFQNGNLVKEA